MEYLAGTGEVFSGLDGDFRSFFPMRVFTLIWLDGER